MKLYRVEQGNKGIFLSMVAGCMRSESYDSVDSAYAYPKSIAVKIIRMAKLGNAAIRKSKNIPDYVKNQLCDDIYLVPISIDDVQLSDRELASAISSSLTKGINPKDGIRQARWERVRKYENWFDYDFHTPSHKYIYTHSTF